MPASCISQRCSLRQGTPEQCRRNFVCDYRTRGIKAEANWSRSKAEKQAAEVHTCPAPQGFSSVPSCKLIHAGQRLLNLCDAMQSESDHRRSWKRFPNLSWQAWSTSVWLMLPTHATTLPGRFQLSGTRINHCIAMERIQTFLIHRSV